MVISVCVLWGLCYVFCCKKISALAFTLYLLMVSGRFDGSEKVIYINYLVSIFFSFHKISNQCWSNLLCSKELRISSCLKMLRKFF